MRVFLVHDQGERQKEVQEAKGNEEKESDVDGEVGKRVTQRAHETWRWRWDEQGTNLSHSVINHDCKELCNRRGQH